jgi:hypothetical protein
VNQLKDLLSIGTSANMTPLVYLAATDRADDNSTGINEY